MGKRKNVHQQLSVLLMKSLTLFDHVHILRDDVRNLIYIRFCCVQHSYSENLLQMCIRCNSPKECANKVMMSSTIGMNNF